MTNKQTVLMIALMLVGVCALVSLWWPTADANGSSSANHKQEQPMPDGSDPHSDKKPVSTPNVKDLAGEGQVQTDPTAEPTPCLLTPTWKCLPLHVQASIDKKNWGKSGLSNEVLGLEYDEVDLTYLRRAVEENGERGQCTLTYSGIAAPFSPGKTYGLVQGEMVCEGTGTLDTLSVRLQASKSNGVTTTEYAGGLLYEWCQLAEQGEGRTMDRRSFHKDDTSMLFFRPDWHTRTAMPFVMSCKARSDNFFFDPEEVQPTVTIEFVLTQTLFRDEDLQTATWTL